MASQITQATNRMYLKMSNFYGYFLPDASTNGSNMSPQYSGRTKLPNESIDPLTQYTRTLTQDITP